MEEIRNNGSMSTSDFKLDEKPAEKRTGWWSWSTTKMALEMLYNAGILMVSYRKNFKRYYDLAENVLSSDADLTEPTEDERIRFFIMKAFQALGVAKPSDVSSYYYQWSMHTPLKGKEFDKNFENLVGEDAIKEVAIEGVQGPYFMLADDFELFHNIAEDNLDCFNEVTFLSPFDNLTWNKTRTYAFFNFVPKLEAYLPKNQRKYGSYNMNVLYRDQLVGRIDPKMHRTRKLLEINILQLEKNFKSNIEFKEKLADAFGRFMSFHNAEKITFRKTVPKNLGIEKYFD